MKYLIIMGFVIFSGCSTDTLRGRSCTDICLSGSKLEQKHECGCERGVRWL
jgi:hypothetical protein